LNRDEAIERVRAEEKYRDEVIDKHQAQKEASLDEKNDAAGLDAESENAVISVLLMDNSTRIMPVQPLIVFCDTAKRMVTSRWRYGVRYGAADGPGGDTTEQRFNTEQSADATMMSTGENGDSPIMELSLVEFDANAVGQFMDVIISLHGHHQQQKEVSSEPSRKRRINDERDEIANKYVQSLINEGNISEKHVVECVKLAHYLQCRVILETLTSVLEVAIDCHNCMAICSLADALNLTSLFESSVNFVIDRLDAFQPTTSPDDSGGEAKAGSSDDDRHQETIEDIWTTLPHELRSRVLTMRNVMRSSVIGRGSKVSGIFFSSGNEFLAIFLETIRDKKERLAEAKERREEVILERTEEWIVKCRRRGQWFDSSSEAKNEYVYGASVAYALGKIELQSRRLATLESFYEEQKTIFKGGGDASEIIL